MTALLVSVRNSVEATEAFAGGAQIIDIKEPSRGPLGKASREIWSSVHAACSELTAATCSSTPPVQLSVACGELDSWKPDSVDALQGFAYAKIGLSGCRLRKHWQDAWHQWASSLPQKTAPVAVLYADYRDVAAPAPNDIIAAARESNCDVILVDTFEKTRGNLFAHLTGNELDDVIRLAREHRFRIALAGSIDESSLGDAMRLSPDWIAVRGAVCARGRESDVERELVKRLSGLLSTLACPGVATVQSATN